MTDNFALGLGLLMWLMAFVLIFYGIYRAIVAIFNWLDGS